MAEFQEKSGPPSLDVYSFESDLSDIYLDTLCYRCSSEFDRQRDAVWHCVECIESFCKKCYPEHFRNKRENWSHTIKDMAGMNPFKKKNLPEQAPVEYLDTSCTPCSRDNKAVRAIRYCKDCEANLCVTCLKWHNANERFMGHTMKRVWEVQMERHEKCQRHPEEVISRFCKEHDVVCCIKCIHLDHRNCKATEEIQLFKENNEENHKNMSIKDRINQAKMNTIRLIQTRKDDGARIEDERHNIRVELQTNRERINEHLYRLDKKCEQELKVRYEKFKTGIIQNVQELEEMLSKLEIEANKLQTLEEDNASQQFIYLKQSEQVARESNNLEKKMEKMAGSEYFNFNTNKNVIDSFCDIESLGDFSTFALSLTNTYEIKTRNNRHTCSVYGSCFMSDGSMIFNDQADYIVKKLDASYTVTAYCKLPHRPTDVCSTSPTEVAIAMRNGTVLFASVTNKISLTRQFTAGDICFSIAHNNGELFVARRVKTNSDIVVFNISGQILRTLVSSTKDIYYIETAIGDDRIYYAENTLGLIAMDTTGNKLWEKTELTIIRGIATTEKDGLIVCRKIGDEITFLLISRDRRRKIELLKEKSRPSWPDGILYDRTNSKLLLLYQKTNKIFVYNFTCV